MYQEILKWLISPKKNKLPPHLIIYVTDNCNLKCRHCYFWKNLNSKNSFTCNEFEKISNSLDEIIWLDIGGGEPFLRDDLEQIVKIFYQQNQVKYLNIPTNGFLTEKVVAKTKEILSLCPQCKINITVSLDGKKETHDSIRGVRGGFDKAWETLERLTALKKKFPHLYVSVCTTVFNKNYSEIIPLLEHTRKNLDLNFHGLNLLRGNPKDKTLKLPNYNYLENLLRGYQKQIKYYYTKRKGFNPLEALLGIRLLRFLHKYYLETVSEKPIIIPCLAGLVSGVIEPNGDISSCELTPKIANIKDFDFDFKKAWLSERAKFERKKLRQKKCFCTHASFQGRNLFFNPRLMFKTALWGPFI